VIRELSSGEMQIRGGLRESLDLELRERRK
jgi:hypothetical protein